MEKKKKKRTTYILVLSHETANAYIPFLESAPEMFVRTWPVDTGDLPPLAGGIEFLSK